MSTITFANGESISLFWVDSALNLLVNLTKSEYDLVATVTSFIAVGVLLAIRRRGFR